MSKFDLRRSIPIMAYVGSNGHGKSLAMIADTQSSLDYGRPVLSTVRILDYRNPRPCEDDACLFEGHPEHGAAHPSFVPLTDWSQVLEMTDCDVLLDEITSSAGSRDTSSLPSVVGDMFNQQRRSDRVVRWTAPAFGLGDIQMRRVTQGVTVCRGSFGKSVPGKLWKQNRFFHWKTYDVTGIGDELVQGLVDVGRARTRSLADVRPVVRQFFWRPGSEIERIYDTYSSVLRVGSPGEHGRCMRCGGRITVPACSCSDRPGRRRDKAEIVAGPAEPGPRRGGPPGVAPGARRSGPSSP